MPFKVMHRKEVTHSNGSYERKSRGRKKIVSTLLIHNTSISLSINLGIIVKDLVLLTRAFLEA